MRPDPHKQAASRKYHNKVKGRGGSVAGASGEVSAAGRGARGGAGAGRGRGGGRGGYKGHNQGGNSQENDDEEEDEDGGKQLLEQHQSTYPSSTETLRRFLHGL